MKSLLQLAAIGLLLSLMIVLSKGIFEQWAKLNDLQKVEGKVNQLKGENIELKTELEEQKSLFNIERQARDKLGFKRPGEVLYVIGQDERTKAGKAEGKERNWELWLDFLFHTKGS
jgi:cell division protein FtsB